MLSCYGVSIYLDYLFRLFIYLVYLVRPLEHITTLKQLYENLGSTCTSQFTLSSLGQVESKFKRISDSTPGALRERGEAKVSNKICNNDSNLPLVDKVNKNT